MGLFTPATTTQDVPITNEPNGKGSNGATNPEATQSIHNEMREVARRPGGQPGNRNRKGGASAKPTSIRPAPVVDTIDDIQRKADSIGRIGHTTIVGLDKVFSTSVYEKALEAGYTDLEAREKQHDWRLEEEESNNYREMIVTLAKEFEWVRNWGMYGSIAATMFTSLCRKRTVTSQIKRRLKQKEDDKAKQLKIHVEPPLQS